MNNLKVLKITVLFLLILCAFLGLIINVKNNYLENKQRELTENVVKSIENQKEQKVNANLPSGAVGLIFIPSIDIEAPIYEGTTKEVLKYAVGHFTNTNLWTRKCCTCFA